MAIRQLRRLSSGGDMLIGEWDTSTVSKERLEEIEAEYDRFVLKGWTPADITDKKDVLVPGEKFNPEADTLLIPRIQGGY